MEQSNFYAMMSRMKYINRWGLMNNTKYENLSEHSLQVAMIAHCLVLIHNKKFGGNLNAERAGILAIFHDTTEIITGDMPTPIKYFNNTIKDAYKEIEKRGMESEGMEQYLSVFKHGMPPHGGLGIGLERLTMKLVGEDNVRETTLFPRDLSRLEP